MLLLLLLLPWVFEYTIGSHGWAMDWNNGFLLVDAISKIERVDSFPICIQASSSLGKLDCFIDLS